MAKTDKVDGTMAPNAAVTTAATGEAKMMTADDVFNRSVNGLSSIKSIRIKTVLTKAIVSMAHTKDLLFRCTGEIFQKALPVAGRSDKPQDASMIEGINLETGEQIVLVLNHIMLGSMIADGKPLTGRCFGFRQGDIKADKRYRVVDVVELEVTE